MNLCEEHTLNELSWLDEMKRDLQVSTKAKESYYNFDFHKESIKPGNFSWTVLNDTQIEPKN
jgi:hypothetical protein